MSNNNRNRTQGRAPAAGAAAAAASAAPSTTDTGTKPADEPRTPANAGDAADPSTRNNENAARTSGEPATETGGIGKPVERPASPGDTGENLSAADTTKPLASASPTAPSPTAAEAEAAADARDHGAAAFAGALDVAMSDTGQPVFSDALDGNGLRIATAFQDETTGQRVAPGDAIPDHIREDGERMDRLYNGGFITDKPLKPAPAQAVPGGTLTLSRTREDGDHGDHGRAQPLGDRRS